MQISYQGIQSLKQLEGFMPKAYKDTGGVWTIGYGTTFIHGKAVSVGQICTEPEAQQLMVLDLSTTQTALNQLVKVPLKQSQFDALVSFAYNVGVDAFRNSTLLKLLNQGQYENAAKQFDRWVQDNGKPIPGLVSRRKLERSMFES